MATGVSKRARELSVEAQPGTWSWLKEYTGYAVTILPYVSAGIVLIPQLSVWIKGAILFVFAATVLAIRVLHEKAGIELTNDNMREKKF